MRFNRWSAGLRMRAIDLARGTWIRSFLPELEASQWLSTAELVAVQDRRLQDLLRFAIDKTPFYQRCGGIASDHLDHGRVRAALLSLPVMNKQAMGELAASMPAGGDGVKVFGRKTGGSTGDPFRYLVDAKAFSLQWAAVYRMWGWAGYRFGDSMATVGGGSVTGKAGHSFAQAIYDGLRGNRSFSAGSLTESALTGMGQDLSRLRPKLIYGYPSLLYELARFLQAGTTRVTGVGRVITTSEMLFPGQRKVLEEVFGCPVFDMYGCNETNLITGECSEHSGLHVAMEACVVEILDEEGSVLPEGKVGRIVATGLANRAMPFIRYDTGDLGAVDAGACSCGRGLVRIVELQGRSRDLIVAADGSLVHGVVFNGIALEHSWLDRFQLVQSTSGDLTLTVACSGTVPDAGRESLVQRIIDVSGRPVHLAVNGSFEVTPGYKTRVVISHMEVNHVG